MLLACMDMLFQKVLLGRCCFMDLLKLAPSIVLDLAQITIIFVNSLQCRVARSLVETGGRWGGT